MKLHEARQMAGISISDAAGVLGVSRADYLELESYPSALTVSDALVLAHLFNVCIDDIFFWLRLLRCRTKQIRLVCDCVKNGLAKVAARALPFSLVFP